MVTSRRAAAARVATAQLAHLLIVSTASDKAITIASSRAFAMPWCSTEATLTWLGAPALIIRIVRVIVVALGHPNRLGLDIVVLLILTIAYARLSLGLFHALNEFRFSAVARLARATQLLLALLTVVGVPALGLMVPVLLIVGSLAPGRRGRS